MGTTVNTVHGKCQECSYNIFKDSVCVRSENGTEQLLPLQEVESPAKEPLEKVSLVVK